ncbi:MAG: molybdopterin molybdotransferase MoeA [Chitinophagaceae bacterium]|nr:molybdopterin molybdotransferase MoeA [Chitinophagaceae bacterium]
MAMITVAEADALISSNITSFGIEEVPFLSSQGRVLAQDICADRPIPPYDRVTMDGIAISFSSFQRGVRRFRVAATMAAGDDAFTLDSENECVEIMTGCALPIGADAIVRYEDVSVVEGYATLNTEQVKQGANVHRKASDKQAGEVVVSAGAIVDDAVVSMAASVGASVLKVRKLPKVLVVSTGDELVDVNDQPAPFQIRRSNSYTISSVLRRHGIEVELMHVRDDESAIESLLDRALAEYDVLILSGGVSMGKYDHLPATLQRMGVTEVFHKVQQRPGKPFWFGTGKTGTTVFAFPGNPVSAFLCLHRYFLPWLHACVGLRQQAHFAVLGDDVSFAPPLQYFLQVLVGQNEKGQLVAQPLPGNGSGDFSNLLQANAFMELPAHRSDFLAGEVFRIWPFKNIVA